MLITFKLAARLPIPREKCKQLYIQNLVRGRLGSSQCSRIPWSVLRSGCLFTLRFSLSSGKYKEIKESFPVSRENKICKDYKGLAALQTGVLCSSPSHASFLPTQRKVFQIAISKIPSLNYPEYLLRLFREAD